MPDSPYLRVGARPGQARAVVVDAQSNAVPVSKLDANRRPVRVARGVRYRLTDDPQQLFPRVRRRGRAAPGRLNPRSEPVLEILDRICDREVERLVDGPSQGYDRPPCFVHPATGRGQDRVSSSSRSSPCLGLLSAWTAMKPSSCATPSWSSRASLRRSSSCRRGRRPAESARSHARGTDHEEDVEADGKSPV